MAPEAGGWHEEAEKLCRDEELMAAVGDRSIFCLDDINLDDIFLDLKDTDIPGFGVEDPSQGALFSSGNLHGSAAESASARVVDAAGDGGGGVALPEGLLWEDIDVSQLEWLSNFCEESYSSESLEFIPCNAGGDMAFQVAGDGGPADSQKRANLVAATDAATEEFKFRTSSPTSVLEHNSLTVGISPPTSFSTTATSSSTSSLSSPTSSSCSGIGGGDSGSKMMMAAPRSPPEPIIIPGRSRSKRPRPANFSPRPPIIIPVPASSETSDVSCTVPLISYEQDNFEPESHFADPMENTVSASPKRKKKAPLRTTADGEEAAVSSPLVGPVRKCVHCEVTKTPQWRAGPMGPKTLCNACGVRYKSGRLFPEYRPAASPTFLASIHSNSHKKVVEMRNKAIEDPATTKTGGRRQDVASKACELLEYIRRRDWCGDDHHRITTSE